MDETQAVPVARATVRSAAVTSSPLTPEAPPNESRGARRRRLGIPRRITFRVVFFVLLVAAIPVAAFYAVRWYAYDNWFLAIQNNQIVVKQGHPAGVLWFHPRVVEKTKVKTSEVPAAGAAQIRAVVQEPSLRAAQAICGQPARGVRQGTGREETATAAAERCGTGRRHDHHAPRLYADDDFRTGDDSGARRGDHDHRRGSNDGGGHTRRGDHHAHQRTMTVLH